MTPNEPYGLIDDGALAVEGDRIRFAGPRAELPAATDATFHDAGGRCILPGFVDPHTHAVYAGDRSAEFEARLAGATYESLAAAGGGILSTVRATRAAGDDELFAASRTRVARLRDHGVTTLEIKSGYGLDRATELRMLRVARNLGAALGVRVVTTYLGLHARDPARRDETTYLDEVCETILPEIARERLADAVDAFCEPFAFDAAEIERYFAAARALGLPCKLHADQRSDGGGAALAARHGALSADHLERSSDEGIAALAASGTVAVLLPGAWYFLRETRPPPLAALRRHGVPIALGTDCNPGTSPLVSPLLAMNLACTLFGLSVEEALRGFTRNAAAALGLGHETGTLEAGKKADFVVWNVAHPAELVAAIGIHPGATVVQDGVVRASLG